MYGEILASDPNQPDALHFLGVLRHQTGESAQAIPLIQKAIEHAPHNAGMRLNLGNICRELDDLDTALHAYEAAIELNPDYVDAWCNLGALLKRKGERDRARENFLHALELNPDHAETHHYLGFMVQEEDDLERAEYYFRRASELFAAGPGQTKAWSNLARILVKQGELEKAEGVLRNWLVKDPDNPLAQHMLAAISGKDVPAQASPRYVKTLFDSFASSFDEVLGDLIYRAPDLVADKVLEHYGSTVQLDAVLDAGCGTGLSGVKLKTLARRLTGVDLSGNMLTRARARSVYDELVEAEIVEYLSDQAIPQDLIVSVDTLNYFGELDSVLEAMRDMLKPDGILCFTLEKTTTSDGRGYQLTSSGRYAHQRHYADQVVQQARLTILDCEEVVLRLESGQPVPGYLYLATVAN